MYISAVLYMYIKVWMRKWYKKIHMCTYASCLYVKKKKRSIPDFVCRNLLVVNDEMCVCKPRYFL